MKLKIIVQALLMLFGVTLVIDSVYARPSSGICFKHTEIRCNANFYSCQENFKQQSNQLNKNLSDLRQERDAFPSRLSSCKDELIALMQIESDRRSEFNQIQEKMINLQKNKNKFVQIQEMQNAFFESFDEETKDLGKILPDVALKIRDLIENENLKIEMVLSDLKDDLKNSQEAQEQEKLKLEIKIIKKLKLTESFMSSEDQKVFQRLISDALSGDNLKQVELVKNNLKRVITEQESELSLLQEMVGQSLSSYQEIRTSKNNKEGVCLSINERGGMLEGLIQNDLAGISLVESQMPSCNQFCQKVNFTECP